MTSSTPKKIKICVVLVLVFSLVSLVLSGALDGIDGAKIRAWVQGAGVWRSQQFTYSTRTVPVTVPVKNVRENNSSH